MSIATSELRIDERVQSFIANPHKLLIAGQLVEAVSGKTFPTFNPATGEVLAQVAEGEKPNIDRAVQAAREAFDQGTWRRITTSERGKLIWKLADLLEAHLAVWTKDIRKAHRIAAELRAGTVWINCYNIFDAALPFGGYKQSGWGREMGHAALELYTQVKAVCSKLA